GAQLLDLILEHQLALLQAAQLQLILRRIGGEPRDDVVEVVVLHFELVQMEPHLHLLFVGQREVHHAALLTETCGVGVLPFREELHRSRFTFCPSYPYTCSGGRARAQMERRAPRTACAAATTTSPNRSAPPIRQPSAQKSFAYSKAYTRKLPRSF